MKTFATLLLTLLVCITQLHLIEALMCFQKKYVVKECKESNDTEENDTEEENRETIEQEKSLHFITEFHLSKLFLPQDKLTFIFTYPIYKNPFSQRDIKPPCLS